MNYSEFVKAVAANANQPKYVTKDVVDAMLLTIKEVVMDGEEVFLPSLCKFYSVKKQARMYRNPKTGEMIMCVEKMIPKCRISGAFKTQVKDADE